MNNDKVIKVFAYLFGEINLLPVNWTRQNASFVGLFCESYLPEMISSSDITKTYRSRTGLKTCPYISIPLSLRGADRRSNRSV
jgi:hypothetical protein